MAEFYGREGSFQDFYLELPTQKIIDRDLSEAKLYVEALKENALIQKEYDKDYLAALSSKYKVQNKNLEANFKLQQANYERIYEAEQRNSQREFEAIQKSQGNPGPKEAAGWGDLLKLAPKLGEMVGEYIQKEREWKINTHTNLIVNMNMKASDRVRWEPMKEELLANSFKAQQFAKAESERFGVQLTPQKMLSIINMKGELGVIQQEAFNFNAIRTYGTYLSSKSDTKIVLSDGTETTWGELQSPTSTGERFLEGLNFMRGQFLKENDININTVPIGPLGDLGAEMRKVEDAHNGRWSRAKSQQQSIQYKNAITTQYVNSIESGGVETLGLIERRARLLGGEKPDYTAAWNEAFAVLRSGINTGTTQSHEVEDIIRAHGADKGGPVMQQLRNILGEARAKESNTINQSIRNKKAASAQLREQYKEIFMGDPDKGGWGLKMRGPVENLRAQMLGQGMLESDVTAALSVFTTTVHDEEALGSNSKSELAKGTYDAGLDTTVDTIGSFVGGDNSGLVDHSKIIGWSAVENDITNLYREFYNRKWDATIGTAEEKAEAAAQYARDEVVRQYKDNPGLTAISAETRKNSKGEDIQLTDEERTFKRYSFGTNRGTSFDGASSKLSKLGDTPGVSPTDRVLSMSKPEDAILDKSDVDRHIDSDGNISLRSFRADPLVREIVKQTGIPASDIYQRHAELYGLPTLSDTNHFTYEELQQSLSKVGKRRMYFNSASAEQVHAAEMNPSANARPAPFLNTSFNVAGLNGTTPNYDNRSFTYVPEHRALLDLISFAEGTYDQPNSGYSTKVGFSQFNHMNGHDRVIPSGQISDASGRYQFLSTTWANVGSGAMTPEAQDWGATRLVLMRLNLPQNASGLKVLMNRLKTEGLTKEFIDALAPEWASLPTMATGTSYYGQGGKSYEELTEFYSRVLGTYSTRKGVEV